MRSTTTAECTNSARSEAAPAPAGSVALVLSHGWTGSNSGLRPLGDAVKRALGSKVAIYYFDYASDGDRWPSAANTAACLGAFIHNISDKNSVKVVYAAHSMGGIAIRFASSKQYAGPMAITGKQLAEVVTIDTPHAGSPWGGTPTAGLQQVASMLTSHGAFPSAVNPRDAWACLKGQSPAGVIPSTASVRCATPPYLPTGTDLTMMSATTSIQRTVFGVNLYTIPLGGDGIVLDKSMSGYPSSGPTTQSKPSGKLRFETVTCSDDNGDMTQALGMLAPPVPPTIFGDLARMFADQVAWDDILAGRLRVESPIVV